MSFIPLRDLAQDAVARRYAVPAFCAWNAEIMKAVLDAAESLESPVIIMQGPGEFPLLDPSEMGAIAHGLNRNYTVPAALHLDHGDSVEMVEECISSKYTSVMLDYSARAFEENVAALAKVVEMAKPLNISVEGELGMIGRVGESSTEGSQRSNFTDPDLASEYVERTGVDLLAVSIGNAHGFYKSDPRLEFGLLEKIHDRAGIPLVLHGGTGLTEDDIRRGISLGIAKVNVASELISGVRSSLYTQWRDDRNPWVPDAFVEAVAHIKPSIEKWIRITGAAGKA